MASAASIIIAAIAALCVFAPTTANAAALTPAVHSSETMCYYAWVDQVGEKVGFYFAVQSGGNFEIDWWITGPAPNSKTIIEGKGDRQVDIIFTGNEIGEYAFCFSDPAFSATKMVDFDITVESEPRLELPLSQGADACSW